MVNVTIDVKYLGETQVSCEDTPYRNFAPTDWAMLYIEKYGSIDGAHHKTWVLDQVARICLGTPVLIFQARWSNGHTEWRVRTEEPPSHAYLVWRAQFEDGDYDCGVCP